MDVSADERPCQCRDDQEDDQETDESHAQSYRTLRGGCSRTPCGVKPTVRHIGVTQGAVRGVLLVVPHG